MIKFPKINLMKNINLKIFSFLFAIVLWLLVTNYNDPVISVQFANIPVTFINEDALSAQGNTYIVEDGTDLVPIVSVTAKRSIVDALSADNIEADADLSQITESGTVEIAFSSDKYNSSISAINGSITAVSLRVEKEISKSLALAAETTGTPAEGYIVGAITTSQNQVRIKGPESVVNTIVSARTYVDVSDYSTFINTKTSIELLDEEGNAVSQSRLTLNIDSVNVAAEILPVANVKIQVESTGTPAAGYVVEDITVSPDSVSLAGRAAVLSEIGSVDIPAEAVNVSGISKDLKLTLKLSDYLPEGVTVAEDGADGNVEVTVHVAEGAEKEIGFTRRSIEFKNVPDGYSAALSEEESEDLSIIVEGSTAELANITENTISPSVDVGALVADVDDAAGEYEAEIAFSLTARAKLKEPLTVKVTVTKKSE